LFLELEKLSKLLNSSEIGTSGGIDTFIYNRLHGGSTVEDSSGMPITLNIIIGVIISLSIVILLIRLWRSNRLVENESAAL
jgi:hypothetical protein